ncbi:hypothetical protein RDABS01_011396 [Bienertia sinuspersici]
MYASMFLYECNIAMMHYFCESWCMPCGNDSSGITTFTTMTLSIDQIISTNTILTAAEKTSIGLWDIRTLANIFYDESVPTAAELAGSKDGKQYLPPSCRYMFAAFWHITSKSKSSYVILPQVVKDSSALETSKPWNDSVHEVFVILDIPKQHRMDTYLATFLTCWLCAFVLPLRDLGCIRPSVSKPASQLASGRRISLAIPVLTCIYKGLSKLSSSFTPGKQVEHFPAHYVYAWLARYF